MSKYLMIFTAVFFFFFFSGHWGWGGGGHQGSALGSRTHSLQLSRVQFSKRIWLNHMSWPPTATAVNSLKMLYIIGLNCI